jgi:hypothetical protein
MVTFYSEVTIEEDTNNEAQFLNVTVSYCPRPTVFFLGCNIGRADDVSFLCVVQVIPHRVTRALAWVAIGAFLRSDIAFLCRLIACWTYAPPGVINEKH